MVMGQRTIKFTNFTVNPYSGSAHSSNAASGTITIAPNDFDYNVGLVYIGTTLEYNQPAGTAAADYQIDIVITKKAGTADEEKATVVNASHIFISAFEYGDNKLETIPANAYGLIYTTDDFPFEVSVKLYNTAEPNKEVASSDTFTITRTIDPNQLTNNKICLNTDFNNCIQNLTQVGSSITNLTINGSTPQKGGVNGNPPAGGYSYQWQIKYDQGAWSNIPGATSINYTLPSTTYDNTYLRRRVITTNYTTYSSEVNLTISICTTPPDGQLCGDQYYYNVTAGQTYPTKKIVGGYFAEYPLRADKSYVTWEMGTSLDNFKPITFSGPVSDVSVPFSYYPGSFTKAWWPQTDVYYFRRVLITRNCTNIFIDFCGSPYQKEVTNPVKIVFSQCDDPYTITASISGPTYVKCSDQSLNYNIVLNKDCGIKNVEWSIPQGWSFDGPSSGEWVRGITAKPFTQWSDAGFRVPQGNVKVKITYFDGKIIEKQIYVAGDVPQTVSSNSPTSDLFLCDGQPVSLTLTANGGTPVYDFAWNISNVNYTQIVKAGNAATITIAPAQWAGQHTLSATITDARGCKVTTPTFRVLDGGWISTSPYIGLNNYIPIADLDYLPVPNDDISNSNIVSELKGNVYYAGYTGNEYKLSTYQWDASASLWRNFAFPKNNAPVVRAGSIQVRETTWGDRTIFYVGSDYKIHSISSINNYQNEFANSSNWTAEKVYNNAVNVKYIMCVTDNRVIFKNNDGKVVVIVDDIGKDFIDQGPVEGIHAAVKGDHIYYVKNGHIICRYLPTWGPLVITSDAGDKSAALAHTNIEIYGNDLFFTGTDGYLKRIDLTTRIIYNTVEPYWPAIKTNGFFSINANTGVIYLSGTAQKPAMNQLYKVNGQWTMREISAYNQTGFVEYRTPNAFYVASNTRVNFTYFWLGNCNPAVYKQAASNEDHIEGFVSESKNSSGVDVKIYPNPVSSELNINFAVNLSTELKFVMTDIAGREVEQWIESGGKQSTRNITDIPPGIYLLNIYDGNNLLKVERIVKVGN